MLKDLTYQTTLPSFISKTIAEINGVDLSREDAYFEHYETGVYRHDGYIFNFDKFIEDNCCEAIADKYFGSFYGVCDDYKQVLKNYKDLVEDKSRNYVIGLSTVTRESQPSEGGWRWHKWGNYIGTQNPQHEYLYDDKHIDKVYCYYIYEIV